MKQLNFLKLRNFTIVLIVLIISISCKTREKNYITYYQKVVEIDSIYRLADNPKKAVRKYKRLFRKYEPKNQESIEEYATYIELAHQYNINFGGQKSLRKLIHLVAPYAHHSHHKRYYNLFEQYSIDSSEVDREITIWKNRLNKELLDSFSIAMDRDQLPRSGEIDFNLMMLNDTKNIQLLNWTFDNYGFPSTQAIGIEGNKGRDIHLSTMFLHYIDREDYYDLEKKLFKYIKSGDCPPQYYAKMVDRHEFINNRATHYLHYPSTDETLDTLSINKNRKELGLPSIKHSVKIRQDFSKKMKAFYGE